MDLDYPNAEYPLGFVKDTFDWEKIKENAREIYVINQEKDGWVPKEKGEEIAKGTNGKLILVEGSNHFIGKMDLNLINNNL